jgi:ParB-like chromosome segregation protein Spo0J
MRFLEIPRDQIVIPKADNALRPFLKEYAEILADSIKDIGILQPPGVRPVTRPDGTVFYEVVYGKHRTYAMGKILGWEKIPCTVLEGDEYQSEEGAGTATIIENMIHNAYTPSQYYANIAMLKKYHALRHPGTEGKGARFLARLDAYREKFRLAAVAYEEAQAKLAEANERGDTAAAAQATEEVKTAETAKTEAKAKLKDTKSVVKEAAGEKVGTFAKTLAKQTGRSKTAVHRDIQIADNLTQEQIEALTKAGIKHGGLLDVARIQDPQARAKCVKLIATGMGVEDAVREAGREAKPVPKKKGAKGKAEPAAAAAPAEKEASFDDLPDDEWVKATCGSPVNGQTPILALLKKKARFQRDAVLYRKTSNVRRKFQKALREALAEYKAAAGGDGSGIFYNMLYRLAYVKHPSAWLVCGACSGTGKDKEKPGEDCKVCFGAAYRIDYERV